MIDEYKFLEQEREIFIVFQNTSEVHYLQCSDSMVVQGG